MPAVIIWSSRGFPAAVDKAAGVTATSHFSFPGNWEVVVEAEVDAKLVKKLDADPALHQTVFDACKPHYEALVKNFAGALKDLNGAVAKTSIEDATETFNLYFSEKVLGPNVSKTMKAMTDAAGQAVADYFKDNADFKKYKFVVTAKIVLAGTGIVVSIALIASSPFDFGAGAVIGAIGLGLSCLKLASLIHETARTVDDELEKVRSVFLKLDKNLEKKYAKQKNWGKEVVNEVAGAVTGLKPFSGTVKSAVDHFEAAELKLKEQGVIITKLSKKLQKTIKKLDDLEAAEAKKKDIPKTALPPAALKNAEIDKLAKKIDQILTKIDAANAYKTKRGTELTELKKHLTELQKALSSPKGDAVIKGLSTVLLLLDLALAAGTGDAAGMAFAGADLTLTIGDYLVGEVINKEAKKLGDAFVATETSGLVTVVKVK